MLWGGAGRGLRPGGGARQPSPFPLPSLLPAHVKNAHWVTTATASSRRVLGRGSARSDRSRRRPGAAAVHPVESLCRMRRSGCCEAEGGRGGEGVGVVAARGVRRRAARAKKGGRWARQPPLGAASAPPKRRPGSTIAQRPGEGQPPAPNAPGAPRAGWPRPHPPSCHTFDLQHGARRLLPHRRDVGRGRDGAGGGGGGLKEGKGGRELGRAGRDAPPNWRAHDGARGRPKPWGRRLGAAGAGGRGRAAKKLASRGDWAGEARRPPGPPPSRPCDTISSRRRGEGWWRSSSITCSRHRQAPESASHHGRRGALRRRGRPGRRGGGLGRHGRRGESRREGL